MNISDTQMSKTSLSELRELHAQVNEIFDSELPWETKYDLIFSERVSRCIFELIHIDYCDPDTSYQEDVTAFVDALNKKMGITT